MNKNGKKMLAIIGVTAMMLGSLTGCGSSNSTEAASAETQAADAGTTAGTEVAPVETAAETQAAETAAAGAADINPDLSGSVSMAGSTSMEKLANALSETFMELYPGVTVTAEFTGSSAGVEAVTAGNVDIGNSSRALKDSEKEAGVVENIVAIDGIAVVVDPANTVADLTKEQLISIYTGEIKNWSELGGADQAIVVVGREAGSGTRGAFEELLEVEEMCAYANELDSTGAVMAKVVATPGAIGYVSLDVVDDTVSAVSLEGVEPTEENIKAGSYFLSRPFVIDRKSVV